MSNWSASAIEAAMNDANKIPKEAKWATLGRAIADRGAVPALLAEAALLRRIEQDNADRMTQFAALARQIGDAVRAGRDTAELVGKLVALRQHEVTGR